MKSAEEIALIHRTIKLAALIRTVAAYIVVMSFTTFFGCGAAGILTGTTLFYRISAAAAFTTLVSFLVNAACNYAAKELYKELEEE